MVESLPANAGDTGSSPGLGGSHMPRSGWAHEPQLLSLRVWSLCSTTREATTVRGPRTAMKSGLRLPQLEKALAQKRRPNTAINKLKKKKIVPRGKGDEVGGDCSLRPLFGFSMSVFWLRLQYTSISVFKFTREEVLTLQTGFVPQVHL